MNSNLKLRLIISGMAIFILSGLAALPFSIYGQDGYFLWFPILSEYLRGDTFYHASNVIFDGQNLAGVYGDLPFWKVLRFFNPRVELFLNLTHGVFIITFSLLTLSVVRGIRGQNNNGFDI